MMKYNEFKSFWNSSSSWLDKVFAQHSLLFSSSCMDNFSFCFNSQHAVRVSKSQSQINNWIY